LGILGLVSGILGVLYYVMAKLSFPDDDSWQHVLAEVLEDTGRYDEMVEVVEKLGFSPTFF
jgi:hypothetical protein